MQNVCGDAPDMYNSKLKGVTYSSYLSLLFATEMLQCKQLELVEKWYKSLAKMTLGSVLF